MIRLRNLSIWLKCLIAPGLSVAALAIIAWVAFDATSQVRLADGERELVAEQASLLQHARSEIERANSDVYRAITWHRNSAQLDDIDRVVEDIDGHLQYSRDLLELLAAYDQPNAVVHNLSEILQVLDTYAAAVDQVTSLLRDDIFLAMMFLNGAEAHFAELGTLLMAAEEKVKAAGWEKNEAVNEIITSSLLLVLTAIAIEFLATSLVGYGLARAISRPVLDLISSLDHLRAGNLDLPVPHTDRRDEIGRVAQAVTEFRDSLRRTQTLEEAERQKREAEQALAREREVSGLQRQFVAMVSHEFRTPLAVIDSSAQRLLRHPNKTTEERLTQLLGRIRRSVRQLTELVESVLSAAHMEEGRIDFLPADCALVELVDEVCANYREANLDRAIMVDAQRLPACIQADSRLLRQVLSNLVSNAVKYSPVGSPVWVTGWGDGRGGAVVTVRDEGIGIPEEEVARLFQRFFRASTSTGISGSGIGLHLAKHLVELHGGKLEVESAVAVGTTFTLRLPAEPPVSSASTADGTATAA